jgi:DNA-binding MarR family transcriptional regulator
MRRCLQESAETFERACSGAGITVRQYDFLFILGQVDELSQNELSYVLDIDRSTTTLVIGTLEKKGYISRRTCDLDSRRKLVRLTEHGLAAFHMAKPYAEEAKRLMLESLSKGEGNELIKMLNRIIRHYQSAKRSSDIGSRWL